MKYSLLLFASFILSPFIATAQRGYLYQDKYRYLGLSIENDSVLLVRNTAADLNRLRTWYFSYKRVNDSVLLVTTQGLTRKPRKRPYCKPLPMFDLDSVKRLVAPYQNPENEKNKRVGAEKLAAYLESCTFTKKQARLMRRDYSNFFPVLYQDTLFFRKGNQEIYIKGFVFKVVGK